MQNVKKMFPSLLSGFFVLLIVLNLAFMLSKNASKYTTFTYWQNFPILKQTYLDSQYVNKHPKGWIPDEAVNAYAGGAYIKGVSPILIAPDTPPLGRYIIGLSALMFNNENILPLLFSLGSLVLLYILGMQIFSRTVIALLAPLFFSYEPLFTNQLVYTPLLDTMQLFFLLCSFYFFNKAVVRNNKKIFFYALVHVCLGLFIATKFYMTGLTVIAALGLTLLLARQRKDLFLYVVTLPIAVIVLLGSYVRVLFDHYTLFKFLGIQKYIFLYHKSQLIYPFSVWALLLLNKWYVWFGDKPIISDAQWRITWPFITVTSLVTGCLLMLRKITFSLPVVPLILWAICYLLFFSVGQITTRYFVVLLPILYLIAIYGVNEVVTLYYYRKRKAL